MTKLIREVVGSILYYTGYPFLERKISFLSIYFHDPSHELFEKIVKWGLKKKYRFIDINECCHIISSRKEVKEKVLFISFDDGWQSNLKLLPIIEKHNIPITIFVSVEPMSSGNFWWEYALAEGGPKKVNIIKKLTYTQFCNAIKRLKEHIQLTRSAITQEELQLLLKHPLVDIQSHTMSHPILTNCPDDKLEHELSKSKQALEVFDGSIYAFSYTNGDYGSREIEAVKAAGYKIAFTTKPNYIDTKAINIFEVPRMSINTNGGKWENLAKIIGAWQRIIKK